MFDECIRWVFLLFCEPDFFRLGACVYYLNFVNYI